MTTPTADTPTLWLALRGYAQEGLTLAFCLVVSCSIVLAVEPYPIGLVWLTGAIVSAALWIWYRGTRSRVREEIGSGAIVSSPREHYTRGEHYDAMIDPIIASFRPWLKPGSWPLDGVLISVKVEQPTVRTRKQLGGEWITVEVPKVGKTIHGVGAVSTRIEIWAPHRLSDTGLGWEIRLAIMGQLHPEMSEQEKLDWMIKRALYHE